MFTDPGPDFELLFVVPRGSPEERWAASFLGPDQLVSYEVELGGGRFSHLDTDRVLRRSNLDELLPDLDVSGLIITHRGTPAIARWSATSGVRIIAPKLEHQRELEDKIAFHRLLVRNELPCPGGTVARGRADALQDACRRAGVGPRVVVQDPGSFGSSGTWFGTIEDLPALVLQHDLAPERDYLVRDHVDGPVFGISVFIERGRLALSAIRRQCFWPGGEGGGPGLFAGISWTPAAQVSHRLRIALADVFGEMAHLLYRRAYRGFVHFDFVLEVRNRVQIFECNPRLSSATPQLFAFPELLGGVEAAPGFIREALTPQPYGAVPPCPDLPASEFDGGLLDIPARTDRVARTFPSGLYRLEAGRGVFVGPDVRAFHTTGPWFVLYSDREPGEPVEPGETLATIMSAFPLFDGDGRITETASQLLEQFDHE